MRTNCLGPFLFNDLLLPLLKRTSANYMESKIGAVFIANETTKRVGSDGILSLVSFFHLPQLTENSKKLMGTECSPRSHVDRAPKTPMCDLWCYDGTSLGLSFSVWYANIVKSVSCSSLHGTAHTPNLLPLVERV